ncbi:MAG: hypothetical protein sL5_03670 [Candidatus Mesenet longicola]|uniref:Uncharacterized protein n=1 Tax=Candidatus Mesenet longicola TaxID=1892558 RepID=A0A8J3MLX8_9RICK|nr:MAG: hypothetical protein sGL2_09190 [Candidatus Mesenet longicola]GHM59374.1 MAG: hypothetical protein sL5_03670 [Candidatus Mesenet longicola]
MLNSRSQDNFIYLLKEYRCPEEVISGILKFNNRDFNLLSSRVKDQSDLLTTLIENGYGSEAFKSVFCQKDDEVYNTFVKYKEFIILLLENKCELKSIECVYDLVKYNVKSDRVRNLFKKCFPTITINFMRHYSEINVATEIYDYFINREKIASKLSSLLKSSETLKCAWEFISFVGVTAIDRYRENPRLFYFAMKNKMIEDIGKLITLDEDKQNFIVNYLSIFSLGDITISELQNKSIKEITQKVETLTKEKISKNQEQLELSPVQLGGFSYTEKGVQSLQTLAVAKIVECLQNKSTSLEVAEVTSVRANSSICVCAIS